MIVRVVVPAHADCSLRGVGSLDASVVWLGLFDYLCIGKVLVLIVWCLVGHNRVEVCFLREKVQVVQQI